MQKLNFNIQLKKKGAPHKLAYEAERLCNDIKIPFSTFMLKAVKQNKYIAESLVSYMKEKKIYSLNYFTKSFNNRLWTKKNTPS